MDSPTRLLSAHDSDQRGNWSRVGCLSGRRDPSYLSHDLRALAALVPRLPWVVVVEGSRRGPGGRGERGHGTAYRDPAADHRARVVMMPSTVAIGLSAALRLARGRADGVALVGDDEGATAGSFWAIAFCLPS